MTAEVCLDLIRKLEEFYQVEFPAEELNAVWPRLLACDVKAGAIAGTMAKKRHRKAPTPEQLARMMEHQHKKCQERLAVTVMPPSIKSRLQSMFGVW